MNAKVFVPLTLAVVMGLAAAFMSRRMLTRARMPNHATPTVSVVVAKSDLAPGHELTADDLSVVQIAASKPPAISFSDASALTRRVIVAPLVAGQPVVETLLGKQGTAPGLEALVPPGMRAITLDVTDSSGLGGLLAPGAHVDVIATAANPSDNNLTVSRLLVQNAPVLAVGQQLNRTRKEGDNAPVSHTVTLLVSPHDAAALDLAQLISRVRLVMRGSGDVRTAVDDTVMLAELRGQGAPVVKPQELPPAPATQPAVQPVAQQATATAPEVPPQTTVWLILGNEEQRLTFRTDPDLDGSQTTGVDGGPAVPH